VRHWPSTVDLVGNPLPLSRPWALRESGQTASAYGGPRSHTRSFRLALLLLLAVLLIDAVRKVTGVSGTAIGIIYPITGLMYAVFLTRNGPKSRVAPHSLPIWLTVLSLWCVVAAIIQQIPAATALLGWSSYVFFVPLLYIGADIMADESRAVKTLRILAVAGAIVGLGAILSALLGSSAPPLLQPIIPSVGFHSFGTGSVYLAPSIFATAEEAAEELLISFFAWIALAYLPSGRLARKSSTAVALLIMGGLIATARRTDIIVAATGVIGLLVINQIYSPKVSDKKYEDRGRTRSGLGIALFFAAAGSTVLISILGAKELVPFLFSGSPGSRLSLMFSVDNYNALIGQGTGTSTQGLNLVSAASLNSIGSGGPAAGYVLNGRTFITAEGGFTKTWLELGVLGVVLYGGVFFSALVPIARSLRRLDGTGRALIVLAFALGIVFLKGHQDLDDPLVQPLFWLAVGGAWGRMRLVDSRYEEKGNSVRRMEVPIGGYPNVSETQIGSG
jgi:hypothetical protein